jgi:hypothetical protein
LTVWAYVHSFNAVHSSYHSYVVLLVSFPVCPFWSGFDILTCHVQQMARGEMPEPHRTLN